EAPRQRMDFLLERAVAEGAALCIALARQAVEVAAARELDGLEVELGRGAADHHGQVVGRAGGGAERLDLALERLQKCPGPECGRGLLEEGLIRVRDGRNSPIFHTVVSSKTCQKTCA